MTEPFSVVQSVESFSFLHHLHSEKERESKNKSDENEKKEPKLDEISNLPKL